MTHEISNPRTGQRMIFLKTGKETNGALLEIESFNPPSAMPEPEHIHPLQESSCDVISGELKFQIDGKVQTVRAGESVVIPAGVRHFFWNDGSEVTHHVQRFKPALTIDNFFTSYFALARDGKLNDKGMPNFFLISLVSLRHQNDIRVVSPPWMIQKPLFLMLAPIAKLLGYKASYS